MRGSVMGNRQQCLWNYTPSRIELEWNGFGTAGMFMFICLFVFLILFAVVHRPLLQMTTNNKKKKEEKGERKSNDE